ncbi:hypothetical protein MICRO116_960001 [Micrococcus sp. 116]|nr:hypothetical protein MICRO116_960001 [Micrococcus sp. 116]
MGASCGSVSSGAGPAWELSGEGCGEDSVRPTRPFAPLVRTRRVAGQMRHGSFRRGASRRASDATLAA